MLRRQQNQKREHPQMIPGFHIYTESELQADGTEKQQKTRIPRMKLLKAPANFLKKRKLMRQPLSWREKQKAVISEP